jgi:HEPN domain-containing protein
MNRIDFQELSELRLKESKALLAGGFPEGAYYLAGYAVECALKACIAKRTQEHDFPDRRSAQYYSHDLGKLLEFAKLESDLEQESQSSPGMRANWDLVKNWSKESRYEKRTLQEAMGLIQAIEDESGGLFLWLRKRW